MTTHREKIQALQAEIDRLPVPDNSLIARMVREADVRYAQELDNLITIAYEALAARVNAEG